MPRRQRDYKAEYRARVARAEARGLTRAQAAGHARRAGQTGIAGTSRDRRRSAEPRQVGGGRTLSQIGSKKGLRAALLDAEASGDKVTLRARYKRADGTWRTGTLDAGSGAARGALDKAARLGRGDADRQASSGRRPGTDGGRPAVTITKGGDGIDPTELLALFDLYDSEWDAIFDLMDYDLYS